MALMASPQQRWYGNSPALSKSRFAGQEMTAITDDAGAFKLIYLGYQTGGFPSIESAKSAAPEFARQMLFQMSRLIDG